MQAAALSQFSDIGFVFIELKQHYGALDKQLQSEFDQLEKAVGKVCRSKQDPEQEITELFPRLFSLRVKAIKWMSENGVRLDEVPDDLLPEMVALQKNPRLKKIGGNISESVAHNKELLSLLKGSGQLSNERMKEVAELDYAAFIVAIHYIPTPLRKVISRLIHTSLSIEFFSIAAVLINEEVVSSSDHRLRQLDELSSKLTIEYRSLTRLLLSFGKQELFGKEQEEWMQLSLQGLSYAYGDNEPDYANVKLMEPNPDYIPWKRDK